MNAKERKYPLTIPRFAFIRVHSRGSASSAVNFLLVAAQTI